MKKIIYFVTVLFTITILNISCEKEEPITLEPDDSKEITINDLLGDWKFVSLDFNGNIYETPEELQALDVEYSLISLDFNITTTKLTYSTIYVHYNQENPFVRSYSYTFNDLIFNCEDQIRFKIVNADSFDGTELKLKLIYCGSKSAAINGIYILKR